jgi:two-component system response regulator HydG
VRRQDPQKPVILMTAQAELRTAIEAVNRGAFYYILKPFSNDDLVAIVRRAAETRLLRTENQQLRREIKRRERRNTGRPLGRARPFVDVLQLAEQVAPTDSTVLVLGESGTGKEVVARYIHDLSERSEGPFVPINCGALPETLLESELFGHVKGSFTGAVRDKEGLFTAARGGTFFLDEIAEIAPSTQVKLLRVLQEREVLPVGGTEPIPVDVRVIAATNRDLDEEMRNGRFRSDLYYRLNVFPIRIPPLRERREDIPLLVRYFAQRFAKGLRRPIESVSRESMEMLCRWSWPGNVRELQNVIERAVILSTGTVLTVPRSEFESPSPPTSSPVTLEDAERDHILRALEQTEWVIGGPGGAAARLGLKRTSLVSTMRRLGIVRPRPHAAGNRDVHTR